MDVVSDILRGGPRGAVVLSRLDYRGEFAIAVDSGCAAGMHWVETGHCVLEHETGTIEMGPGDVALFPRGDGHVLADGPGRDTVPLDRFVATGAQTQGAFKARVVCAAHRYATPGRRDHPLVLALPALVHVPAADVARCPSLRPTLALLRGELEAGPRAGRDALVSLLLETLLVLIVRHWLDGRRDDTGWVGAIRDPRVTRALNAVHAEPGAPWSVPSLADLAGMSRAAFARRFGQTVGEPPLTYVTRVRMEVAAERLTTSDAPLAQVADELGYRSEFAFSRAFKRWSGEAPGRFRTRAVTDAVSTGT